MCVLWVRTQEVRPPLQLFHIRRDLSLQLHTLIIFLATLLLVSPTFPKLIMKVSSFLLHPNDSLHVSVGCDKLTADWNMTIKPWGRQFCPLFIRNMHPPSFARMHIPPFNDTIFPFALLSSWAHHAVPSTPPMLQHSLRLTVNTSLPGFSVQIPFSVFSFLIKKYK